MRGKAAANFWFLYSWQFIVASILVLAGFGLAVRWSGRRREASRRATRYEFDERGRMVEVPAATNPHQQCTRYLCFAAKEQAGRCPRATGDAS